MISRRAVVSALAVAPMVAAPVVAAGLTPDPTPHLVRTWMDARAAMRAGNGLCDEELDRIYDLYVAAEDRLFVTPATTAAGALACLDMIEACAREADAGRAVMFTADELVALMAGARAALVALR